MEASTAPSLNREKYENAVLYFTKNCNNQHLGKTKLNKLFYYLDFISYRDRKKSVTGDSYRHDVYGPVPCGMAEIESCLAQSKSLSIENFAYKDGYRTNYKAVKKPEMSVFDDYEKELLQKICGEFKNWRTKKIVEQTHIEAPWFYSKPSELVDYEYSNDIDFFDEKTECCCN